MQKDESLGCSFGVKHAALGIGCNGCVLLRAWVAALGSSMQAWGLVAMAVCC